jgi:hypothetical protein
VLETVLAAEMTAYPGYDKHDPAGRDSGNCRNGMGLKTPMHAPRLWWLSVRQAVARGVWARICPGSRAATLLRSLSRDTNA